MTESATIRLWAERCKDAISETLPLVRAYFQLPSVLDDAGMATHQLAASCTMSSESALLLVAYDRLWDADILVRSVFEGSLKVAHLCSRDSVTRETRARQFVDALPEIGRLKAHERAQLAMDAKVDWKGGTGPFTELLLSAPEAEAIRQRYPTRDRKVLEQEWSFAALTQSLDADSLGGPAYARALLHGYRMSSHLIHKDWEGVGIVWEREQRDPVRLQAIRLAHAARLCSDVFALAYFRAHTLFLQGELDRAPIHAFLAVHKELLNEWHSAYSSWHAVEYAVTDLRGGGGSS